MTAWRGSTASWRRPRRCPMRNNIRAIPRRKLVGIRRKGPGWRADIRVNGTLLTKQFPLDTPIEQMRAWRDAQVANIPTVPTSGSFAADIQTYLARVQSMPSYDQRAAHLELWAQALGRE